MGRAGRIITGATFVMCAGVGAPPTERSVGGTHLRGRSSGDRQDLIRAIPAKEAQHGRRTSVAPLSRLTVRFANRRDAGRQLGIRLGHLTAERPIVVGLPRGGIPVAYEVAQALGAPLDVLVVRKLGCPWQPELGVGALGEGGIRVLNESLLGLTGVTERQLEAVAARESAELEHRVQRYRGERQPFPVTGRTVIVVDDGLATGFTARAGIEVLRRRGAQRIVLAVPVAPSDAVAELRTVADDVVCLHTPSEFQAIGQFYDDFTQTTDDDVAALLTALPARLGPSPSLRDDPPEEVAVAVDGLQLPGTLHVPPDATGLVLFAHGSGSSRLSPRNISVSRTLNAGGIATLLFDLLTPDEAHTHARVFDVDLLAARLIGATHWVGTRPDLTPLRIGYFGASTGAAAALLAAAHLRGQVGAVVSRGGRPDLAAPRLGEVTAPTLLIVGSRDELVLDLNDQARRQLRCPNQLAVVPGATHLFEERGALAQVAALARDWFTHHLATTRTPA
jgi:putative phosphoribosyl transferase